MDHPPGELNAVNTDGKPPQCLPVFFRFSVLSPFSSAIGNKDTSALSFPSVKPNSMGLASLDNNPAYVREILSVHSASASNARNTCCTGSLMGP